MSRNLVGRSQQPILPPKGKQLRPAAVPPTPEGEEAPVAVVYAPAKLQADVLNHVKVYCALHKLEMQDFLTKAAEVALQARGYLPASEPEQPHEQSQT